MTASEAFTSTLDSINSEIDRATRRTAVDYTESLGQMTASEQEFIQEKLQSLETVRESERIFREEQRQLEQRNRIVFWFLSFPELPRPRAYLFFFYSLRSMSSVQGVTKPTNTNI